MEEKICYYINQFKEKGITEDVIREIVNDRSYCPYKDMICTFCSCGCFKINLLWILEDNLAKGEYDKFRELYDRIMFEKK